jgi:hypothetical protein
MDYPDECPTCHFSIRPRVRGNNFSENTLNSTYDSDVYLLMECPRPECGICFSAKYQESERRGNTVDYEFYLLQEATLKDAFHSEVINKTSDTFVEIYNQAYHAEQQNLDQVCGVGYRKALEFLIKDYLVSIKPDKAEEIKKNFLGNCINDYIDNPNIKLVAERAVWIGNDETHYTRKWTDRTLEDLKTLIDLTVRWIEMEVMTKEFEKKMPKGIK